MTNSEQATASKIAILSDKCIILIKYDFKHFRDGTFVIYKISFAEREVTAGSLHPGYS
jgi:hypothetical protein